MARICRWVWSWRPLVSRILGWGLGLGLGFSSCLSPLNMPPASAMALSPAVAQTPPAVADPPPASAPSQPDASTVPSEMVSRFVTAYLEVVKLIESREQNLQSAETETESRQMQQEIQAEAVSLIQAHDLTLQAYWELLGLANSDPEFRERVLAQIEEANL